MKVLFALLGGAACRMYITKGKRHFPLIKFFSWLQWNLHDYRPEKNSNGKEFSLFMYGFILGFITQFYHIFPPFWFMIFAWTLPEIIIKIIPECEKNDPYYIYESVKWSRSLRRLICKKTAKKSIKASFLQTCWKERKRVHASCSLLVNTLSLEQETNTTETVTFICHFPSHVSDFLHFK